MKLFASAALAVLLVGAATGCSGDSDITVPTDRITVTPAVTAATLSMGASTDIFVTVTRPVGYTGRLELFAENLPAGVTGVFSPPTLEADATVSTLTLTATAGATAGDGAMLIRASGTGLESQTATVTLSVGGDGVPVSFLLSVTPSAVFVAPGASASATVSIDRTGGFNGPVALQVSGFPAGITAAVSPGSTSSNSATISILTDATVPGGSYTGTVTAQGAAAGVQTTSFTVTIVPAIRQ
ncbi:MAG: hypothetical protein H7Z40_11545 [Phycisphaerae bacterium]|nr:hypothetical protein [Gemmatimonadaceae bacterium]